MMGRVKEAPVEAEMRTAVSKVFQLGWAPYGPWTKARTSTGLPGCDFFSAYRYSRLVKPLCVLIAIVVELRDPSCVAVLVMVNGCDSMKPMRGTER